MTLCECLLVVGFVCLFVSSAVWFLIRFYFLTTATCLFGLIVAAAVVIAVLGIVLNSILKVYLYFNEFFFHSLLSVCYRTFNF